MDKKSKSLLVFFVLSVLVSIFLTYKRSFVDGDFIIEPAETEEAIEGNSEETPEE